MDNDAGRAKCRQKESRRKSWSLTWMKERSRGADRNLRWSRVVEKCRRVGTNYSWRMHPSRAERQCGFESPDKRRHSQLCVCTHLHLETLSNATAPSPLKHKTPWDGRSQQTPPSTSSSSPKPINSLNHFQLFSPPPVSEMPLFEGDGVKSGSWLLRDCSCVHSGGFGGQSWGGFCLCLHYYSHQNLDICWADALIWEYLRTFPFEMKMKSQN